MMAIVELKLIVLWKIYVILKNVVYQGIIFPKENIKDNKKKQYRNFIDEMEIMV